MKNVKAGSNIDYLYETWFSSRLRRYITYLLACLQVQFWEKPRKPKFRVWSFGFGSVWILKKRNQTEIRFPHIPTGDSPMNKDGVYVCCSSRRCLLRNPATYTSRVSDTLIDSIMWPITAVQICNLATRIVYPVLDTLKPGFHYPSWWPELTGDRFPFTRQLR